MVYPVLDEHSATFRAERSALWRAVRRHAAALANAEHRVLGRVLGTEPRSGFELAEEIDAERLVLAGRHRFARYRLVFELGPAPDGAITLSIRSLAAFPGARGRIYRSLLMWTGGHRFAVRRMLGSIRHELADSAARRA